jgi:hypothetical protein
VGSALRQVLLQCRSEGTAAGGVHGGENADLLIDLPGAVGRGIGEKKRIENAGGELAGGTALYSYVSGCPGGGGGR